MPIQSGFRENKLSTTRFGKHPPTNQMDCRKSRLQCSDINLIPLRGTGKYTTVCFWHRNRRPLSRLAPDWTGPDRASLPAPAIAQIEAFKLRLLSAYYPSKTLAHPEFIWIVSHSRCFPFIAKLPRHATGLSIIIGSSPCSIQTRFSKRPRQPRISLVARLRADL